MTFTLIEFITIFTCAFSTLCAIISISISISNAINFKALRESTHSVQFVPMDPEWASSDKEVKEINELSEANMPEFDDDELEEGRVDLKHII